MGLFKSRFYSSAEMPVIEKILALIFTLSVLFVISLLVRKYSKSILQGLRKFRKAELGIVTAIFLAFLTKIILDGLPRKLDKIGVTLNEMILNHYLSAEQNQQNQPDLAMG